MTLETYPLDLAIFGGKTGGGEWIDVIRFRDWLQNDMQVRVVNLLIVNPKIPYTDNGIGLGKELSPAAEGVGISNTRRRLFHLYGEHQRFELRPAAPNGVRVELDIPFSTGVK